MKKQAFDKKGFTVIEVVLVLAIAGLIFAMAFIALPALQRNQRDAQRRDDMATFVDALKKFQTNNRGALPKKGTSESTSKTFWKVKKNSEGKIVEGTTRVQKVTDYEDSWRAFYEGYLRDSFVDPSGVDYQLFVIYCEADGVTPDYNPGSNCNNGTIGRVNDGNTTYTYQSGAIIVVPQATCDGSEVKKAANPRKIAVLYGLEGSGVYCINS